MTTRPTPPVKKNPWITAIIIISIIIGLPLMGLFFVIQIGAMFAGQFMNLEGLEDNTINRNSMLVLDLSRTISDRPDDRAPGDILGDLISGNDIQGDPYLRQLINAIHKAEFDDRINGIVIYTPKNGQINSSLANIQEVRDALKKFSENGKPIIAYLRENGLGSYYLASVADEIYINPMGMMYITGYGADPLYMKEALDKIGIGVQVARVGEYKSAVEPFLMDEMSPENKEQLKEYLSSIWNLVIADIADDRHIDKKVFNFIANTMGLVSPEKALEMGLVDKIGFEEDFSERLAAIAPSVDNNFDYQGINIDDYVIKTTPIKRKHNSNNEDKIAVLYAEGSIVDGNGGGGSETLKQLCADIRNDDSVKAIVLRIDSPGGSVMASEDILYSLEKAAGEKPLVVSMGGMAASGGYYITAHSDKILADRTTLTGSIGVFGLYFNGENTLEKLGLTPQFVTTHNFSTIHSPLRQKSPQEMVVLREQVVDIYNTFLNHVAQSRNMTVKDVNKIARGHIWGGEKALDLGLIDAIGGLEDSIEEAANLANIKNYHVVDYPREDEMTLKLKRALSDVSIRVPDSIAVHLLKTASKPLQQLNEYTDPRGAYMRLPFNLREE
jgi:protease-4